MKVSKIQYDNLVKSAKLLEDLEFFNCIDYNKYNREQDRLKEDLIRLDNKHTNVIDEDWTYENI